MHDNAESEKKNGSIVEPITTKWNPKNNMTESRSHELSHENHLPPMAMQYLGNLEPSQGSAVELRSFMPMLTKGNALPPLHPASHREATTGNGSEAQGYYGYYGYEVEHVLRPDEASGVASAVRNVPMNSLIPSPSINDSQSGSDVQQLDRLMHQQHNASYYSHHQMMYGMPRAMEFSGYHPPDAFMHSPTSLKPFSQPYLRTPYENSEALGIQPQHSMGYNLPTTDTFQQQQQHYEEGPIKGDKAEEKEEGKTGRIFRCPTIGCDKVYRNNNGLKYHVSKGKCNIMRPMTIAEATEVQLLGSIRTSNDKSDSLLTPAQSPISNPAFYHNAQSNTTLTPETQPPNWNNKHTEKEVVVKPYSCKLCSKRYKNMNGMKYHAKVVHPGHSHLDISLKMPNASLLNSQ